MVILDTLLGTSITNLSSYSHVIHLQFTTMATLLKSTKWCL